MEKACISGVKRDDAGSRFIDEIRDIVSELDRAGVPTVVEHVWWKHPVWTQRGNETKLAKVGDYIFTIDYSSHEAEDEKGTYYTKNMCIWEEPVKVAKERIEKHIKDIKERFLGDEYFESMGKRLVEFLAKI